MRNEVPNMDKSAHIHMFVPTSRFMMCRCVIACRIVKDPEVWLAKHGPCDLSLSLSLSFSN